MCGEKNKGYNFAVLHKQNDQSNIEILTKFDSRKFTEKKIMSNYGGKNRKINFRMFICVYNRSVWKSQRENSFKAGKRRKKKSSSFSSIDDDDDDKVQILGWIFLLSIATAFRIKNEKRKTNETKKTTSILINDKM